MDRETKNILNSLYQRQKEAEKNYNYYELRNINKQIFEINNREEKEQKRLLAIEKENRLAKRIDEILSQKEI